MINLRLATNNKIARNINDTRMAQLEGEGVVYTALSEGDVKSLKDTVENELLLKEGAQVMFTRNDPLGRWVNGTLGTVTKLTEDGITVEI